MISPMHPLLYGHAPEIEKYMGRGISNPRQAGIGQEGRSLSMWKIAGLLIYTYKSTSRLLNSLEQTTAFNIHQLPRL